MKRNFFIIFVLLVFQLTLIFGQSGVEYQKLSFSTSNEYFIKWNNIDSFPVVDIYIDSTLITSRSYSDTSILLKNIPKYDIPFFEIKYFNSSRTDGFSYSFPLNDRPSGVEIGRAHV